jgi:GNAT superfamily N-acetyltransferase
MTQVQPLTLTQTDPEAPEAIACLAAYFALLQTRIPGVSAAHVPVPDPHADEFRPPAGIFLLARLDGHVIGCGSLRRHDATTGEVKRVWVDEAARGKGVARALMTALEAQARTVGLTRLILDTNSNLTEALALYRATGWLAIPAYSGPPADRWFAKPL